MDLVILAVGHKQYKSLELNHWKKIVTSGGIIFDIKSIYPIKFFKETTIKHIRV